VVTTKLALQVCGTVAVLGGLVFAGLQVHPAPVTAKASDLASWQGRTAQGRQVSATIDGKWLDGVALDLELRCGGGARAETLTWAPAPDLFAQQGDAVSIVQPPRAQRGDDGWTARTEGRVTMVTGDHPHGIASVLVRWHRGGEAVVCTSGRVAFSLARAPDPAS
jgi:hypothetical protein